MNFNSIGGDYIEGFCLIKTSEVKTTAKGMKYLDLTLADSDGEINAKYWNYSDKENGCFTAGEIVKIRGTMSPYNGVDQVRVDKIRTVADSDGVNPADFIPSCELSPENMFNELLRIADNFEDEELKALVTAVYTDNRETMLYMPAAYKLHHAIRGGLLYHVLSIVRLAEGVCRVYPFVDKDLLIAGAMLHDIAKISEFSVNKIGLVEEYSAEGNLLGHIPMGAMLVDNTAKRLGLSRETAMLVEHMILSHHGDPEYGAAVRPMFLEAELLSELDLMDSRVYEINDAVKKVEPQKFTARQWALDNVKLYNHNRKNLDEKADLL